MSESENKIVSLREVKNNNADEYDARFREIVEQTLEGFKDHKISGGILVLYSDDGNVRCSYKAKDQYTLLGAIDHAAQSVRDDYTPFEDASDDGD